MMKKLIFATNNPNKLAEIKSAVNSFEVVGLKEMGINDDIAETGLILKENAATSKPVSSAKHDNPVF